MGSGHKPVSGDDFKINGEGLGKGYFERKYMWNWRCGHYTVFEHTRRITETGDV